MVVYKLWSDSLSIFIISAGKSLLLMVALAQKNQAVTIELPIQSH